jgi:hypothetical protein
MVMDIVPNAAREFAERISIMVKIVLPIKSQKNQYSKAFYRERIAGTKFYYGKKLTIKKNK